LIWFPNNMGIEKNVPPWISFKDLRLFKIKKNIFLIFEVNLIFFKSQGFFYGYTWNKIRDH